MSRKKLKFLLFAAGSSICILGIYFGGLQVQPWLSNLYARWMIHCNVDKADQVGSLIRIIENPAYPLNTRIVAVQQMMSFADDLYNPALAIRFSTATLALLTNETYHSMIKHRAESHGIDPEHHLQELKDSVFMMRGYASVDTGNYSNALKDLLRIEHINRQDFLHYHKALGAAAYNVGNWALAVKSLTNIITGPDDNAYYRAMLGESCLFLEHYEKAESNLLRALSYDTNTVRPYILLANLYSRCPDHTLRDGDGALEFINRALLMAPSEPERLYETKACALAEAGRFDESVAYLEKAMAFAKSTPGLTGTLTFLEKELHAFNNKQTFIKGMDSQADTNRAFKPAQ